MSFKIGHEVVTLPSKSSRAKPAYFIVWIRHDYYVDYACDRVPTRNQETARLYLLEGRISEFEKDLGKRDLPWGKCPFLCQAFARRPSC